VRKHGGSFAEPGECYISVFMAQKLKELKVTGEFKLSEQNKTAPEGAAIRFTY